MASESLSDYAVCLQVAAQIAVEALSDDGGETTRGIDAATRDAARSYLRAVLGEESDADESLGDGGEDAPYFYPGKRHDEEA